MTKSAQVERSFQLAINSREHVQVERRRHAERIVVSRLENRLILLQIRTKQKRVAFVEHTAHRTQKSQRLVLIEVADIRTEEERECSCARLLAKLGETREIVCRERFDLELRIRLQQDPRAALQRRRRD